MGLSQYGSLGPWNLGTRTLECWNYETLGSWNCGTPNLASCNLRAMLPCLETESSAKNFEPCTLWNCRVDALLWIILIIVILRFSQQRICWVSISGAGRTLLELCWNLVKPCWNVVNLAGTSLEPCCLNLWLAHFARNQCGWRFRFSFYIVFCFA